MTGPSTSLTRIERLREWNEQAWREFVMLYGPIAYRLAKKKGFDRERAEEIVQRVCYRMVQWLPRFRYDPERGGFRKAVLTFALNEIRQYQRAEIRETDKRRKYQDVPDGGAAEAPEDAAAETWWNSAETVRLLQLACEELKQEVKPRDYEVFEALVFKQRKPTEVAADYGITRNLVDGIKFRMLKRLRAIAQAMKETWDER